MYRWALISSAAAATFSWPVAVATMLDEGSTFEHRVFMRDESDLVVARRHVRELGGARGLSAVAIEALATAVTELARNVLVHAGGGEVRLRGEPASANGARPAAVIVHVCDRGPGISDVDAAMADGFSTGPGLGLGLPGARRLVDVFELRSAVGEGTTIRLEKWATPPHDHL
jgi:serine/threonine-protein kinase RsbT